MVFTLGGFVVLSILGIFGYLLGKQMKKRSGYEVMEGHENQRFIEMADMKSSTQNENQISNN